MFSGFIKRILQLLLSVFLVITLSFFLMKIIPGDPFLNDNIIPEEILSALKAHYGLDKPLWTQYIHYLNHLLHGDLGPSYIYLGRKVHQFILESFPISFMLGLQSLSIAIFFGLILGTLAAHYHNKWQDNLIMSLASISIAIPSFLLATLLQYLFAIKLQLVPVARWTGLGSSILPAIALAATPTAFIVRLIRSNMIDVIHQNYLITAKAKGLSSFHIIAHHGLRNAIMPVISYLGPISSQILIGSFVIEKIFSIPGLGQWLVLSISNRDYPMILGISLFYATLLIIIMFIVDLLYVMIDPRLRTRKTAYG